jgi:hypothetical protein
METNTSKERRYFSPSHFQDAMDTLKGIQKESIPVVTNFNAPEDVPRDHGILIQPILERNKEKKGGPLQLTSYIVAHVPDLSVVQKTDEGVNYLLNALSEVYGRRLKQDLAQAAASHTKPKLPQTMEEFITSETRDNAFQNLMQATVRKLKENGGSLALITQGILKNTLQSAQFARGMFPKIQQKDWEKVLDSMIAEAKASDLDTTIIQDWKDNRDTFTIEEVESINF